MKQIKRQMVGCFFGIVVAIVLVIVYDVKEKPLAFALGLTCPLAGAYVFRFIRP